MTFNAKEIGESSHNVCFDKTLSSKDMQEYGFIPDIGIRQAAFLNESNELTENHNMDKILAYMYTDVPYMKLVKSNSGHSISVYQPNSPKKKEIAEKLVDENQLHNVCRIFGWKE